MLKQRLIFPGLVLILVAMVSGSIHLLPPNADITRLRLLFNTLMGKGIDSPSPGTLISRLKVPGAFHLNRYATDVPGARMLLYTEAGDLLVTLPRSGAVMLLGRDNNKDGEADHKKLLLGNLNRPHGLALWRDWLYIAETDAIGRVLFNTETGSLSGQYQRIVQGLPEGGNHWSKSIGFSSDGWLYLSIGSRCNVCIEKDPRRATMMRFRPDGSAGEVVATGLRNSVGFDWAPWDGTLYATDNGRDLLGDDYPPCELNRIEFGQFYGWPYINGFGDLDPDQGEGKESMLAKAISPVFGFRAHNAPLGILFNRSDKLPDHYHKSAFVALHGSWNRSTPDGYKLISLHWDEQDKITSHDFLTGFEKEGDIIGRPVDIAQGQLGELYVSDDYSGTVYRIIYEPSTNDSVR
ncbi:MAG: PQQ-dependent sugar dehydrogenase [Pseudomonadales bacterium]|nr:PQQ-dependent sugar dehydrogenase [Pseudomonadales bacterium]